MDKLEKTIREEAKIQIIAEQEEIRIRGNCLASGDDAEDELAAVEIERQLNAGNVWAWAAVEVSASWGGLTASDYLGACSYEGEAGFIAGGYYEEMRESALNDLIEQARRVARAAV